VQDGTAHVVRYRSRHNPGRPNWARILYKGHEDDVFKNQPNLLCNFYHWVDSPEKRFPEQFWACPASGNVDGAVDRSKVFYCSKAFYCNWTNNPILINKKWWHDEYEVNFDKFKVRCGVLRCCSGVWTCAACVSHGGEEARHLGVCVSSIVAHTRACGFWPACRVSTRTTTSSST
jgi:hypothetical protein